MTALGLDRVEVGASTELLTAVRGGAVLLDFAVRPKAEGVDTVRQVVNTAMQIDISLVLLRPHGDLTLNASIDA